MLGEVFMRVLLLTGAAALAAAIAGEASAAELVLDQAVARVVVIPEARADIEVSLTPGRNDSPQVRVSRSGDRVTLSSGTKVRMCNFDGDDDGDGQRGGWIMLGRNGPRIDMDDFASVTVRAPRDVRISGGGGAVLGSIGRSQTLSIAQSGCASWTAADVAGGLSAEMSTGANLRAGATQRAGRGAGDGHRRRGGFGRRRRLAQPDRHGHRRRPHPPQGPGRRARGQRLGRCGGPRRPRHAGAEPPFERRLQRGD
jgi:hypothetical protein